MSAPAESSPAVLGFYGDNKSQDVSLPLTPPTDNAWNKKSPWGKASNSWQQPCNLTEVMSEQLALELSQTDVNTDFDERLVNFMASSACNSNAQSDKEIQEANDELLAKMLQQQLDEEDNKQIKLEERKYNGNNKVSISYEKYCSTPLSGYEESYDFSDDDENNNYDGFGGRKKTEWEITPPEIGQSGISGKGKNITTKHDAVICGRKNASKLIEFSDKSGDGEGMNLKLPNDVYNRLRVHSSAMNKRFNKVHEKKEHSTAIEAIDHDTHLILFQMINNGIFEKNLGIVSTGKESIVLYCDAGENLASYMETKFTKENNLPMSGDSETCPKVCAIKVFKTSLSKFKNRKEYFVGDSRFKEKAMRRQNPRKVIRNWSKKEAANLHRLRRFGIPCPTLISLKNHVLVMSFIGHDHQAAPKLRDANFTTEELKSAFQQTCKILRDMYHKCNLVHADLSEYNLLWHDNIVWVIDVSQSVELSHPSAMEFLLRDCFNVCKFFESNNVQDVPTPEELFNSVTDLQFEGKGSLFLHAIQRFDKDKKEKFKACKDSENYAFDYFFETSVPGLTEPDDEENLDSEDADSS
ncbi:serine/threonine-protein kinase RIO3 [Octopus sinensis]|uniref:Serine/threonine-protein kinase RIO3 n=1 Tax=Octopus sinensis TaxID=2607531 RepID=A0A6P7S5D6_9MOLL|nr:serine/threonine-protein kinase RIO3 [Octopus sinensis]